MKQQLTFDDIVRWATPVASFLAEIQPAWDRMVAAATADPAADYDEIAEFEAGVEGYEDEDVMVDDEGNAVDMGTKEPYQHPRVWGPGEEPPCGVVFHVPGKDSHVFQRISVNDYVCRPINSNQWADIPGSEFPANAAAVQDSIRSKHLVEWIVEGCEY